MVGRAMRRAHQPAVHRTHRQIFFGEFFLTEDAAVKLRRKAKMVDELPQKIFRQEDSLEFRGTAVRLKLASKSSRKRTRS